MIYCYLFNRNAIWQIIKIISIRVQQVMQTFFGHTLVTAQYLWYSKIFIVLNWIWYSNEFVWTISKKYQLVQEKNQSSHWFIL